MEIRYDLLLKERFEHKGYIRFTSKKILHSEILNYMYSQIKDGIEKEHFRKRSPELFEINVEGHSIYIYTLHRSSRVVKVFKATQKDDIKKSLELIEERMKEYGIEFIYKKEMYHHLPTTNKEIKVVISEKN